MLKDVKGDLNRTLSTHECDPAFAELARRQGVRPVEDFQKLIGHPSAEDETAEEFAAMLREWRREEPATTRPE